MSWDAPVPIFEDEDENALISKFVELMAAHYPNYTIFEIADEVFKGLRDPGMRSQQAALIWFKEINIKERIKAAKRNGNKEFKELTKNEWLAELLSVTRDDNLSSQDKKVRLEGLKIYGESQHGWFTKAIEKILQDNTARYPSVRFERANAS